MNAPTQTIKPEISLPETSNSEYKTNIHSSAIISEVSNPTTVHDNALPSAITTDERFVDELIKQIDFLKSEMAIKDSQISAKDEQLKAKDIQISAKDEQIKEFQRYVNVMIENSSASPKTKATFKSNKVADLKSLPYEETEIKKILNSTEKKPTVQKKRSIFDTPLSEAVQQHTKPATISSLTELSEQQADDAVAIFQQPVTDSEKIIEPVIEDKILKTEHNKNVLRPQPFSTSFVAPATTYTESPLSEEETTFDKPATTKRSVFDMPLREMEYVEPDIGKKPTSNLYDINMAKSNFDNGSFNEVSNHQNDFRFMNQNLNIEEHFEDAPNDDYYDDFNDKPTYYEDQPRGFLSKLFKKD